MQVTGDRNSVTPGTLIGRSGATDCRKRALLGPRIRLLSLARLDQEAIDDALRLRRSENLAQPFHTTLLTITSRILASELAVNGIQHNGLVPCDEELVGIVQVGATSLKE